MNLQHKPAKRSFKDISNKVENGYNNFALERVNDHCLRMAVFEGEYRWHFHERTDELFIVLEGKLKIEIENNEPIYLEAGEFITIPAKTIHKTSAVDRTVNLTFEKAVPDTIFVEKP